jgi:hypothetical protein
MSRQFRGKFEIGVGPDTQDSQTGPGLACDCEPAMHHIAPYWSMSRHHCPVRNLKRSGATRATTASGIGANNWACHNLLLICCNLALDVFSQLFHGIMKPGTAGHTSNFDGFCKMPMRPHKRGSDSESPRGNNFKTQQLANIKGNG